MAQHTGAGMFADLFAGYGVSHVSVVPRILNRALVEMERRTDITRVVTHTEKAAACMADGPIIAITGGPCSPPPSASPVSEQRSAPSRLHESVA